MTARPEPELDVVNTFGFAVPCRRFHFAYSVTHDRRLPVVDEFVLRLLALGASLPAARIGGFLGLSARELGIVLADLQARGLVEIKGESVQLSRRAAEAFRASGGNPPRIVEVTPWNDAIWIDLISRNIMVPSRVRPTPNLIALSAAAASRHVTEDFARAAFEQNFRKIVAQVRGTRRPDRFRLYSVSSVVPDRFGSVVVRADLRLSLDPGAHTTLATTFGEVEAGDPSGLRELVAAVQAGVRRLTSASPSAAGLQDFRRLTGDGPFAEFLLPDGGFRLREWFAQSSRRSTSGRTAIYGQIYVARNVERLTGELVRLAAARSRQQPRLEVSWLRPAGSDWGATPDLASAIEAVTRALRPWLDAGGLVRTTLLAAPGARRELERFRPIFHAGLVTPETGLASGTEVLAVGGVAAAVMARLSLGPNIILPVGLILTAPEDLARVERVLRAAGTERGQVVWQRGGAAAAAPEPSAETAGG